MPPVKWKTQQIFQPATAVASVTVGAATVTPIATTARAITRDASQTSPPIADHSFTQQRHCRCVRVWSLRRVAGASILSREHRRVERRTATYTSPTKAEIVGPDGEEYDSDHSCCRGEHENERWVRRTRALEQVPGQQSDAQRAKGQMCTSSVG